ncbi:MAG: PorT family protein [Bacteroidales bacterium]|nr:PorT family protein [Bacteroidales bacterium]
MSEDWLKIVKEKMESVETPAPEGVWEHLETELFPAKTHKVRYMPWVWGFAVAAALALGVFAGVRMIDRVNGNDTIKDDNRIAEGQVSPNINNSSSVDNGGDQAPSVVEPIHIIPAPKGSSLAVVSPSELIPDEAVELPVEVVEPPVEVQDKPTEVIQDQKKETVFKTNHDGEDWSKYMPADGESRGRGENKPSAGFSFSSAARNAQDASIMDTRPFFQGYAANFEVGTRDDASIYTRTVSVPVSKDEDHHRPVRLSLSLDFPLNDVLSLGTGLTYSILHSTFTTSSGNRVSEDSQTLGYLGLPLNLKANLWDKDVFTVYALGGGMVEKCVSGVSKTSVTVGGESTGSVTRNTFAVKPLAWSLNAGAGLQLNLPGGFGLYAEPGVSYHLSGDSKVRSIYTEHPFDFVLAFGARFSFR